jgi:hypothetical protein
VAAATMTPIPLTIGLIVQKIRQYLAARSEKSKMPLTDDDDVKESESKQKLMVNGNGDCAVEANGHV